MYKSAWILTPVANTLLTLEFSNGYAAKNSCETSRLRIGFFGEYSKSEILSHPTCKTRRRMNEISRKFPEFAISVKKGLEDKEQFRHGTSDVGNGC